MSEASDALHIAQMGISLGGSIRQSREFAKKQEFDEQYNTYYKGIEQDPDNFKADADAPNYRADAFNKAQVDFVKGQMDREDLKAKRFQNIKADIDSKQTQLLQFGQEAESIAATNPDAAVHRYMEAYKLHPNGISTQYNESTGMWDFKDNITKQTWSQKVTLDDARQTYQGAVNKETYAKMYLTDRSRVKKANEVAVMHPDILTNEKGETIQAWNFIDPQTGEPAIKYADKSGKPIEMTADDILRQGFRMKEDRQKERLAELGIEEKQASINQHNTAAAKNQAETENAKGLFKQQKELQELENKGYGLRLKDKMEAEGLNIAGVNYTKTEVDKILSPIMEKAKDEFGVKFRPEQAAGFYELTKDPAAYAATVERANQDPKFKDAVVKTLKKYDLDEFADDILKIENVKKKSFFD